MDKRGSSSSTPYQTPAADPRSRERDPLLLSPAEREALGAPWDGSLESPMADLLTPTMLEDEAYPVIFARGQAYAQAGNILRLEIFQNAAAALVAGSSDEPYQVILQARASRPGAPQALDGCSCTCPFATDGHHGEKTFCKHMVAVGLVAGSGFERVREAHLIGLAAPEPDAHPDAPRKSGLRI